MRGEDIPKTRYARGEGEIKMTSTIEELNRIGMLFSTLSGRMIRDRGGGTRQDISVEHLP